MLEIKNLSCKVKDVDKKILDNFNLNINDGEIHVIMGPNGTGKSTLSKVIMGHYNYEVTSGDIIFDEVNLMSLDTAERARLGIFLSMQEAPVVSGVSNSEFLKEAINEKTGKKVNLYSFIKELESNVKSLDFKEEIIHRYLNDGFSGGEKKKNEVLQLKMLKPKFIILDELDSGLDVDSLKICCDNINEYLSKNKNTSVLIITHYPKILSYIKPDYVHVMNNGKIVKTGDYSLAELIEKNGYNETNDLGKLDCYE